MTNMDRMQPQFTISNTAALAASSNTSIRNTSYFNDVISTSVNPFPASGNDPYAHAYRFLDIINNSTATLIITLNNNIWNTIVIPPKSFRYLGPQDKIAFFDFNVRVDSANVVGINEIYISGRRTGWY